MIRTLLAVLTTAACAIELRSSVQSHSFAEIEAEIERLLDDPNIVLKGLTYEYAQTDTGLTQQWDINLDETSFQPLEFA